MATIHQPLLDSPKRKIIPSCRTVSVIVSFVAIVALSVVTFTPPHLFFLSSRICEQTRDPASCYLSFSNASPSFSGILHPNPVRLLGHLFRESTHRVDEAFMAAERVGRKINDQSQISALAVCKELLDISHDRLLQSQTTLESLNDPSRHADAQTWISAVLTNYVTCFDELEGDVRVAMQESLQRGMALASTSLAVLNAISPPVVATEEGEFLAWVSVDGREFVDNSSTNAVKANVVVAKDGSGNYKTVGEAIASAPENGKRRYVIYVKAGIYKENVEVGKNKVNVMIVGDGMDSTIITGSRSNADGFKTLNTATFAVLGDGFIAQDICFQNTAGPSKHQAVALRVTADRSVINRCKIDAYQDSLYVHENRQFYRDCYITGTVDFIFGNAAAVLQNCKIVARKPMDNQKNTITAHGREDLNEKTGITIQKCQIIASSDLKPVSKIIPTYLGRPWKMYSRTVIMQSYVDGHVSPAGWLEWDGDFALKTLYYGEYMNGGRGSGTNRRVRWGGYHVITDANVAKLFTVGGLLGGGSWLKSTGVAYTEWL